MKYSNRITLYSNSTAYIPCANLLGILTTIQKPKVMSKHASPHRNHRQTFKVIDLDGTNEHIELAKKAILTLTHQDVIQFLHEQPSQ